VGDEPDAIEEALALARRLPAAAIAALFHRYGKPLAAPLPPPAPDDQRVELTLDDGSAAAVRALEVRTPVDVIANHWFVLEPQGKEPLAIPGPLFAAALAALSRPR
jgi:hypothetical protein